MCFEVEDAHGWSYEKITKTIQQVTEFLQATEVESDAYERLERLYNLMRFAMNSLPERWFFHTKRGFAETPHDHDRILELLDDDLRHVPYNTDQYLVFGAVRQTMLTIKDYSTRGKSMIKQFDNDLQSIDAKAEGDFSGLHEEL